MSLKPLNWGYWDPHLGAGTGTQSVKGLPSIPEALGSITGQTGVVAPASHPSPHELEDERFKVILQLHKEF